MCARSALQAIPATITVTRTILCAPKALITAAQAAAEAMVRLPVITTPTRAPSVIPCGKYSPTAEVIPVEVIPMEISIPLHQTIVR